MQSNSLSLISPKRSTNSLRIRFRTSLCPFEP
nr:MAG TPA: hypothetical protein [Caudoviricetes sp.]